MKGLLAMVALGSTAAQQDYLNSSAVVNVSNSTNASRVDVLLDPDQPNRRSNPNIRLASNAENPWGQHCADGRVEIDHGEGDEEVWGTICSNGWTQADVEVVCSMLGFDYGKAVWPYYGQTTAQLYGEGFTTIWLDEVACEGDEKYIGMCKHAPWGNVSCTHGKEAGVVCSDYKLGNSTTDNSKCAKRDESTKRGETTYFYGKGKESRAAKKSTQQQALAAN